MDIESEMLHDINWHGFHNRLEENLRLFQVQKCGGQGNNGHDTVADGVIMK
jgi:hypothetical protein